MIAAKQQIVIALKTEAPMIVITNQLQNIQALDTYTTENIKFIDIMEQMKTCNI